MDPKKAGPVGGRSCENCACSYLIKPPTVATREVPDPTAVKPQWVCRLNPPYVVTHLVSEPGPRGPVQRQVQGLVQAPTTAESVCWHWRHADALPGEAQKDYEVRRWLKEESEKEPE